MMAVNLVVVDIPVERIGKSAFASCRNWTAVAFPSTLTLIEFVAFYNCTSLENVDLLHTNLHEIGSRALDKCSELTSMTILDSLQKLEGSVFRDCSKLVPSNIDVREYNDDWEFLLDTTPEVVAHLSSKQSRKNTLI